MKLVLVRIGNSRGIRIPKALIEQCGFGDTVDVLVEENRLVLIPERATREGWKETFAAAGAYTDDAALCDAIPANEFDDEEWSW
jgi:antitoxin MazE